MKKKLKSLKDLKQTDGKLDKTEKKSTKPVTIAQVTGDTGLWKYNTMDVNEYKKQLSDMNLSDLQKHATDVDIRPIYDRERLMTRLVDEFNKFVASYNMPPQSEPPKTAPKNILDILSRGR